MATTQGVHQAASTGFDNAAAYDAHRPSYPPEAVQGLLSRLSVASKSNAKIVDLAAGTGKFTELLAAREEQYEIQAVEPVAKMREQLVAKKLRGVEVRDGLATKMDVSDGWADAVIAAQSFHWFAHEEALAEIRRVLKPGGKLGIIWNIEDYNAPRDWDASTEWEAQMNELVLSLPSDGADRFRDCKWGEIFDRQAKAANPYFNTPIGNAKVPFTVWRTKEGLRDRVHTMSQVAVLEGAEKAAFTAKFDEIVTDHSSKWNDKGELEFHGSTTYYWTTRT